MFICFFNTSFNTVSSLLWERSYFVNYDDDLSQDQDQAQTYRKLFKYNLYKLTEFKLIQSTVTTNNSQGQKYPL